MKRKEYKEDIVSGENYDEENDIWMINIVEWYENWFDINYFEIMCLVKFCFEYRVFVKF